MKRFQTFLAVLLLALVSLGAQAQRADELAIEGPTSAQERSQRQERGGRGGGPSLREVNQAARDGDIAKARSLIDQLLQKQPDNARAHFVKAQLAARDRDAATARAELQRAEQLAPGLPFARGQAVANLRKRLDRMEARDTRGGPRAGRNARDGDTARSAEGPAEVPGESRTSAANDAGSTTAAGNTGTPVETRTAGEDTRNMGATTTREAAEGSKKLIMGVAIGAVAGAVLVALFFRRRRPSQG